MTSKAEAKITFEAGIMLCGQIRNFLKKCQFEGKHIEFWEGEGWLSHEFVVKGDVQDVTNIKYSLDQWMKEMGKDVEESNETYQMAKPPKQKKIEKEESIPKEKPFAKYLQVKNKTYSYSERDEEEYGHWEEDTINDIQGIKLVKEDQFYDVIADFDINLGEKVFLVYATYDTGDSFGHSTGNIKYIGVWKDRAKAQAAVAEIKRSREAYDTDGIKSFSKHEHSFAARFVSESGETIVDGFPSWCGYFESLESAEMIELTVN